VNTYYTAALTPAVGGLLGTGAAAAWSGRARPATRRATAAVVALGVVGAAAVLTAPGTHAPTGLVGAVVVVGAVAVVALLVPTAPDGGPRRAVGLAAPAVAVALLLAPTVAAVTSVADGLGPFDTPFQGPAVTAVTRLAFGPPVAVRDSLPALRRGAAGSPVLATTETAALAAPFIWASGREVVPIGGFTGTAPSPTLAAVRADVAHGVVRTVLQAPHATDPRLVWIAHHCLHLPTPRAAPGAPVLVTLAIYYCTPGDAGGTGR
jgi:hypothetical protein